MLSKKTLLNMGTSKPILPSFPDLPICNNIFKEFRDNILRIKRNLTYKTNCENPILGNILKVLYHFQLENLCIRMKFHKDSYDISLEQYHILSFNCKHLIETFPVT